MGDFGSGIRHADDCGIHTSHKAPLGGAMWAERLAGHCVGARERPHESGCAAHPPQNERRDAHMSPGPDKGAPVALVAMDPGSEAGKTAWWKVEIAAVSGTHDNPDMPISYPQPAFPASEPGSIVTRATGASSSRSGDMCDSASQNEEGFGAFSPYGWRVFERVLPGIPPRFGESGWRSRSGGAFDLRLALRAECGPNSEKLRTSTLFKPFFGLRKCVTLLDADGSMAQRVRENAAVLHV